MNINIYKKFKIIFYNTINLYSTAESLSLIKDIFLMAIISCD